MKKITSGLFYEHCFLGNNNIGTHIISYQQKDSNQLTLLISKISEAILPNTFNNHIGEGATFETFLEKQKGVRFLINGGFNHYRKNFYHWHHQNFNIGDPVGIVKIREHYFNDYINLEQYGFLVQKEKGKNWDIIQYEKLNHNEKYILGCTPLLIWKNEKTLLSDNLMKPVPAGEINPPSMLGHGLQYHPRTAIGIKDSTIYFIIVDNNNLGGCTLPQLQDIGQELNLDSMLNLDGGGSSQFRLIEKNDFGKKTIFNNNINDKNRILGHALVIFDENLK